MHTSRDGKQSLAHVKIPMTGLSQRIFKATWYDPYYPGNWAGLSPQGSQEQHEGTLSCSPPNNLEELPRAAVHLLGTHCTYSHSDSY